jgi:hypothetical protein
VLRAAARLPAGALVRVGLMNPWIPGGGDVADYLPTIYVQFLERFPEVAEGQGALARAVRERNPFDARTDRLIKIGGAQTRPFRAG